MNRSEELISLLCEIRDIVDPDSDAGPDSFNKLPGLARELKKKADKYDEFAAAPTEAETQKPAPAPAPVAPSIFTVGSRVRWESRGDSGFGTVLETRTAGPYGGAIRVQCDGDADGAHWFWPDCLTPASSLDEAQKPTGNGLSEDAAPSTGHAEQWSSWLQELREMHNGHNAAVADLIASRVNTLMGHMPPDWPFDRSMHWAFTRAVKMVRTLDRRHVPYTPNERKTLGIRQDRRAVASAEKRFPPGTLVRWRIPDGHYHYGEVVRVTFSPGQVIVHVQENGVGPTIPLSPAALSEVPRVGSRVIVQCSNGRQLRGQVEEARTDLGSVRVRGDGWCCDFALGMIEPDKEKPQ